jgi:hypothetical protein
LSTRLQAAAALAVGLCLPTALDGQTALGSPSQPRAPGLPGSAVFLAPGANGFLGPVKAGAGLRFAWGQVESVAGEGRLAFRMASGVELAAGIRLAAEAAGVGTYDGRAVLLAVAGRRWGVQAGYNAADAATGSFQTDVRSADARIWLDLGLLIGLTGRSSDVVDRAHEVIERRYIVAGYEFVSRDEFSYLQDRRYQDLELDVTGRLGPVRVTAVAGRGFSRDAGPDRTWGYVQLSAPVLDRFEVLAEAGRDPGLPAVLARPSSFARLGLRVNLSPDRQPAPTAEPPYPVDAGADSGPARAWVEADAADGPTLVVSAPDASTVEVRGDFTEWRIRPMRHERADEWTVAIRPGVLRFNVRLDGGDWIVPGGVAAVPDEFSGSAVAIVVVADD